MTVLNDDTYFSYEDNKIRDYEKSNKLDYTKELGEILRKGKFENNLKEENFLLKEYSQYQPDEAVNIIEEKLMNEIKKHNIEETQSIEYFQHLHSIYFDFIKKNGIDEIERKTLLDRSIHSPYLRKTLDY